VIRACLGNARATFNLDKKLKFSRQLYTSI
jgi:hypothetical protein